MIRTRVGYAGGQKPNPTYHNLGDHTETLQIDFDPEVISYRELLDIFWQEHRPVHPPWSRQYMSAVFCADDEQYRIATELAETLSRRWQQPIHTEIQRHWTFTLAEGYHQKYRLQGRSELMDELRARYPSLEALLDSPTAMRLNGYLSRSADRAKLAGEIGLFDLSEKAQRILTKSVR